MRILIVEKNHPHLGEHGELPVSPEGTVQIHEIFGKEKFRVKLVDCKHGIDSCFVDRNGIRFID